MDWRKQVKAMNRIDEYKCDLALGQFGESPHTGLFMPAPQPYFRKC